MNSRKGFTIVELLVVVAILGIFAVVAIPRIPLALNPAKQNVCDLNVDTLDSQIELWAFNHNGIYPNYLSYVTLDLDYFPSGVPVCPAGGIYTMDAVTRRTSCDHVLP